MTDMAPILHFEYLNNLIILYFESSRKTEAAAYGTEHNKDV